MERSLAVLLLLAAILSPVSFIKQDREHNWIAEPEHFCHFKKLWLNRLLTFVIKGIAEHSLANQKLDSPV